MKITYSTNAWGPVLAHWAAPNCVNAAYYRCGGKLEQALADIAEAGFESVEIFDGELLEFEGRSGILEKMLEKYGLTLKGVYIACNFIYDEILPEELDRVRRAAQFAKNLGATEIALGGGAIRFDGIRESDYVKLGEALDRVCDLADELGMRASFHPHMGSLVESPVQLDKVMPHTRIRLCPDLAHVKKGGGDPFEVVKKYLDRIDYIHLKDIMDDGMFCPLGVGILDIDAIVEVLRKAPHKIEIAVECDGWAGDPAEGARITSNYLRKQGF